MPSGSRLAGNLPYYVASPLLRRFLDLRDHVRDFHALVQERRTYIPQGWSKGYEFSYSDLKVALEIIDNLLRPFTLNLRLLMNMFADHLVLDIFTDLTRLIVPIAFYLLGSIVVVIQAFVFTVLSMVYVSLATAGHGDHDEEHAHGH